MHFGSLCFLTLLVAIVLGKVLRKIVESRQVPPIKAVTPDVVYPDPYHMEPGRKVEI